ncbi:hypothetical protein ZHAS_00007923 [Anopheles sinensis]|uniref:Uncharacterized protein n=1 Tax=Anopheles sinensis TaxID=74873 RepID=A0A084VR50_ANOSI|nr:hypothetical protein ZHAS_00007923 [Anopheles sinensis]
MLRSQDDFQPLMRAGYRCSSTKRHDAHAIGVRTCMSVGRGWHRNLCVPLPPSPPPPRPVNDFKPIVMAMMLMQQTSTGTRSVML